MQMIKKITGTRLRKNVTWIFCGNVLHSFLGLLFGMYVARRFSLNDNGLITYAGSITSLVGCVCGLGFSSTISREFAKHEEETGDYLCSCIFAHVFTGFLGIVLLQVVITFIAKDEPELRWIVLCQSLSLVLGTPGLFVYWFRYENKADIVAILRLVAFFGGAIVRVLVIELSGNIILYVIASLCESAFFATELVILYVKKRKGSFTFSRRIVTSMIKGSYPFIFSALLSTIYAQADKTMLKSLMDNSSVALYSVAAHLAGAIATIPTTLIEAFRPEIMEMRIKNIPLYEKRFRQLYAIIFWASIAYCLLITIFAKQIILILYTEKYIGAVDCLSLVVWYSEFSYFGSINNMYMVSQNKEKWVIVTTLTGALANVALNFVLIPIWGIMGAALASLVTQFFANFVMMFIIRDLRSGAKLMIKGIFMRGIR